MTGMFQPAGRHLYSERAAKRLKLRRSGIEPNMPPRWFNMSHNSRRWTPATVWILQKMVWIIEIFGQSPRFSLAETKISPALRFMEMAFWAVFAGISHSAGVQRSDLWVKLNQRGGM